MSDEGRIGYLEHKISSLEEEITVLKKRIQNLQDRITWHRDGFREISNWPPEIAAQRTRQYALDTLTGPTADALQDIRARKEIGT